MFKKLVALFNLIDSFSFKNWWDESGKLQHKNRWHEFTINYLLKLKLSSVIRKLLHGSRRNVTFCGYLSCKLANTEHNSPSANLDHQEKHAADGFTDTENYFAKIYLSYDLGKQFRKDKTNLFTIQLVTGVGNLVDNRRISKSHKSEPPERKT